MMEEDTKVAAAETIAEAAVPAASGELEQVFRVHNARVFRAAYRITGNTGDAEDVLQTVFLRLAVRRWTAAGVRHLETYLVRAAVNAALDVVRRRHDAVPLENAFAALEDRRLEPDRRHDARELRACLRASIARLSPRAAEMFALRYFEGCANPEIADVFGVSQNEVAVTLHRTRNRLQTEIRSILGDSL